MSSEETLRDVLLALCERAIHDPEVARDLLYLMEDLEADGEES